MPPEVTVHFNVSEPLHYLCRLLRKAAQSRLRTLVCVPPELLVPLDQALWTFSAEEFIAHARWSDPDPLRTHSSMLLADAAVEWPEAEVLVNAHPDLPAGLTGLRKLIDIVATDEVSRAAGRRRWKAYAELGWTLRRHDAATGAAA